MGIDIHVHLFGTGDGGPGCRLSTAKSKGLLFRFLARKLGLRGRAKTLDERYVLALAEQMQSPGWQGRDPGSGCRLRPARQARLGETHFYVPNDYLFQVVARYPAAMIPCVSINPKRADAIAELDRCTAKGARLLKIHPPTQGVDLAEKKHARFFRRCAGTKMIVMVHTGHEHSAPIVNVVSPVPQIGVGAGLGLHGGGLHCGTGWWRDRPDMLPAFLPMLRKHRNLWGDTAILGSPGQSVIFCGCWPTTEPWTACCTAATFPSPRFRSCLPRRWV